MLERKKERECMEETYMTIANKFVEKWCENYTFLIHLSYPLSLSPSFSISWKPITQNNTWAQFSGLSLPLEKQTVWLAVKIKKSDSLVVKLKEMKITVIIQYIISSHSFPWFLAYGHHWPFLAFLELTCLAPENVCTVYNFTRKESNKEKM